MKEGNYGKCCEEETGKGDEEGGALTGLGFGAFDVGIVSHCFFVAFQVCLSTADLILMLWTFDCEFFV